MRRGKTPLDRAVRIVVLRQASFYGVTPEIEARAVLNSGWFEEFIAAVRHEYKVEMADNFQRHGWA